MDSAWGPLILALAFFVLGRLTAGVGRRRHDDARAPRNPYPSKPSPSATAPMDLPAGIDAELRALVARGDLIEAIRRYRAATGADLQRSKEAIDALRRRLQERSGR
jgi:hypothetical protein